MTQRIEVQLNQSVISFVGTYKDDWGFKRNMDGFKVDYISGRRVYLITVLDGIKRSGIAKQMQFESGNVFVKFGSQSVNIGTYQAM